MADIVVALQVPDRDTGVQLKEKYKDMGDGTHARVVSNAGSGVTEATLPAALAALGVPATTTITIPQLDIYCLHTVNGIRTFEIANAGTGFSVDDYLDVAGGNSDAQVRVRTVDGSGAITLAEIVTEDENMVGSGYAVASGVALSGGLGTGATINILSVGGPFTLLAAPGVNKVRLPQPLMMYAEGTIGYSGSAAWINCKWNDWGEIYVFNASAPLNYALSAGVLLAPNTATVCRAPAVDLFAANAGVLREASNWPITLKSDAAVHKILDGIATFSIGDPGTGYVAGNYFTVDDADNAVFRIDTVDGSGGVTAATRLDGGFGYSVASGKGTINFDTSQAGSTGSGLTINILSVGASNAVGKVIVRYEDVTLP